MVQEDNVSHEAGKITPSQISGPIPSALERKETDDGELE
jgi:hypothetical protein